MDEINFIYQDGKGSVRKMAGDLPQYLLVLEDGAQIEAVMDAEQWAAFVAAVEKVNAL